jgi:small subunit ribosomal protein S9
VTDENTPDPAADESTEAPVAEEPTAEAAPDTPAADEAATPAPAEEPAPAEPAAAEEAPAEEPAPAEPAAAEAPAATAPPGDVPAADEPPAAPAPPRRMPVSKGGRPAASLGTGRRKEAVARVRLVQGTGQFNLGGRTLEDVFPNRAHRMQITAPLRIADRERDLDVVARLHGGGVAGQAGALRHGIARALIELDPDLRARMKAEGFLTRDSREKERRKYGLKKARKAPQYSKR